MTARETAGALIDRLSSSPEFIHCWRELVNRPVPYREFTVFPMPPGVNAVELWSFFTKLRKSAGTVLKLKPWFKVKSDESWFYLPKQTEEELRRLVALSSSESHLNEVLEELGPEDSGLSTFMLEEICSVTRRDGITISQRNVHDLYFGYREPQTPGEQVVKNMCALLSDIDHFSDREITVGLIELVHERLLDDVKGLGTLHREQHFKKNLIPPEMLSDRQFAAQMLELSLEDCGPGETYTPPVIASAGLTLTFWDLNYFPSLNSLTEYVIRCIYFRQMEMPVLAYVPFSSICQSSQVNFMNEFIDNFEVIRDEVGTEEGIDCTLQYSGFIHTYLEGLLRIRESVLSSANDEETRAKKLKNITGLNKRQRTFLLKVSRNTSRMYKIQDYIDMFDVAYGTASKDLFGIVEMGLMTYRKVGKAFVFQGVPAAF